MSAKLDPRTGAETAVSPRARSLADTVAGAPWRQTQVWDLGQPPSTVRSDTVCKLTHCKPMCEFGGMGARRADPSDTLSPVDEILVEPSNLQNVFEASEVNVPQFKGQYALSLGTTANRTEEIMVDIKYPTTPVELYNYMYDSDFFVNFLTENQRVWDLEFDEWKHRDEDPNLLMRDFHYTKPMSGIGPKEVYCQEHEENQHRDENTYIETETTTHTPDVTYGKSFYVVTHTKISWAENRDEGCVLNIVLEIVWTGWSPFKGMIEGRIIDGQKQYSADLDVAIRKELASVSATVTSNRGQRRQQRRTTRALGSINPVINTEKRWGTADISRLRAVQFGDCDITFDEEKRAVSGVGTELHLEQRQSLLHHTCRQHRLRLAVLLGLASIALTLIVFRLFQ